MICACWNIRGFSLPLKHNGVRHLIKEHKIDVLAILESKINKQKLDWIMKVKFPGWMQVNNFEQHDAGRIIVMWNPSKVGLINIGCSAQVIHCRISCLVSHRIVNMSFIYGLHSIVNRRPLWSNIVEFSLQSSLPWLLLGDFNNVLHAAERVNGVDVSTYEVRDFQDCCMSAGLSDLQSMGCYFTWSNNSVWSKLDRVLVNSQWWDAGFSGLAHFLPPGCLSDHSASIVSIFDQAVGRRRPFKFFNMWAEHEDFTSIVASAWNVNIEGYRQFSLCKKLSFLKGELKKLNLLHFSHISARAERASKVLKEAQLQLSLFPDNSTLRGEIPNLQKNARRLANAEHLFLSQKAKCSFLKDSDRCTKFFHSMVKRRAKRNFIASVFKQDGSPTDSVREVEVEFIRYYKGLLGTSAACQPIEPGILESGPCISIEQASALTVSVSQAEIKAALFGIGNDKSPGPDGFSSVFFKKSWSIIRDDFCSAIQEFFVSGKLLKQLNHSVIALIPKAAHASSVSDFRPISCCNVIYKVISKIIASRLAMTLDSIIDQAQSAFVQGRSMADNIHLAQEILRGYNRKRTSPRCVIKVDLKKAFDSINWDFLRSAMTGLGFPNLFISWVMECVTSPSYSIQINGSLCGFFSGQRGLRQGDPLSPFLFVICLEYLSRLLKAKTVDSDFNFHPKCGQLKISHLAFADDIMLMARGDPTSVNILMRCLKDFAACSGLHVNDLKSCLFTAGIVNPDLDIIAGHCGFPTGSLPFRYLGIPLAADKLKVMHYSSLIEKISASISAWSSSSLSFAGRTELIRATLQGIDSFWLAILPIPATVIDKVTSLCRKFLWNGKKPLVAWSDLCLPKAEGGLGLKDNKWWNYGLLSKTLWNIHAKKDSLWIRWVHSSFLQHVSIWEWAPKKDASPLFKRIAAIRELICQTEGSIDAASSKLSSWATGSSLATAKAYEYFRIKGTKKSWAKEVWATCNTPKHSFIVWLAVKSKLLTRDNLSYLAIDRTCPLCISVEESVEHLFFSCHFCSSVWDHVKRWLGIRRAMSSIRSSLRWLKKEARGTSWRNKAKLIAFSCTVYCIWNARNRFIFEGQHPNEDVLVRKIKTHVYRVLLALYPHVLILSNSLFEGP